MKTFGKKPIIILFLTAFLLLIVGHTVWANRLDELDDVDPTMWIGITNLIRQNATSLTYDDLLRYPDKHKHSPIVVEGKIVQCISSDETRVREYRVNITQTPYGSWDDNIYLGLAGPVARVPLLEGDIIDVAGYTGGTITYTTILGNRITIPVVYGHDVRLLAKRNDPWPPKQITEAEAIQIVQSSEIHQQAVAAYAEWWTGFSGTDSLNISYSINSSTFPDNIDCWWVVATNDDADPNIRSQSHILLLCVDKITRDIYN